MQIEKDVPLPTRKGPRTEIGKAVATMEVGESFVVMKETDATTAMHMFRYYDRKGSMRKMDGGWRIWRVA